MSKTRDLTGKIFGRWLVLYKTDDHITPRGQCVHMWMCECQCEKHTKKPVSEYSLINGASQSCGCYRDEVARKDNLKNRRENGYDLTNENYGVGYTQSGKEFYFDKEDYNLISQYCWDIDNSNGYPKTIDRVNKTGKLYLHRLVMGCIKGDNKIVDHINRNRVDCRKSNLRIVNSTQSAINKGIRRDNTSGVRGVAFNNQCNKWEAYITINKKRKHIGLFDSFESAMIARKEAEKNYFGEYAPK